MTTPAPATLPTRAGRAVAALLRWPSAILPLQGWMLVTERVHPRISGGLLEVTRRTRHGVTLRLDLDDYVQRGIFYDAYEMPELAFVRRALRPGDLMIDVGAHVGIFSLVAARSVGPSGEVHAFEPLDFNVERIIENARLNGFNNIKVNRSAVGARAGEISLGLDPALPRAESPAWRAGYAVGLAASSVTAPIVSLDDYARGLPAGPIRFVKVDVEGYEPDVFEGMRGLLAGRRIRILMMEINLYALSRYGYGIIEAVRPLQEAGYLPYRLGPGPMLRRWSYRGEPSIKARRGTAGLLTAVKMGLEDLKRNFNLVWVSPGQAGSDRSPGEPDQL